MIARTFHWLGFYMADQQVVNNTQQGQAISRPPTYAPELETAEVERVRVNYVKWGLGCAGLLMLLASIGAMFALIVTPVVFRNMLPEQQQIWMHRLPFLEAFKPTRIFQGQYLPTVSAAEGVDASSLLTPSDPISMLLMLIPLVMLYEVGIWLCTGAPQPKSPFAVAKA